MYAGHPCWRVGWRGRVSTVRMQPTCLALSGRARPAIAGPCPRLTHWVGRAQRAAVFRAFFLRRRPRQILAVPNIRLVVHGTGSQASHVKLKSGRSARRVLRGAHRSVDKGVASGCRAACLLAIDARVALAAIEERTAIDRAAVAMARCRPVALVDEMHRHHKGIEKQRGRNYRQSQHQPYMFC